MRGITGLGLRDVAAPLGWIAFFSFFLNVLYLAAPLYMMQVYDRVMRSQSVPTLVYLTLAVALSYAALAALDAVRGQILAGISDIVENRLGSALLAQATAPSIGGAPRPGPGMLGRDLDTVRQFAAGSATLAFLDLPWAPIYLFALVSLHWSLGIVAALAGLVLLALTIAGERAARGPMARANQVAGRAYQFSDVMTRYGDCASTMALAPGLASRWRALRGAMLTAQSEASRRVVLVSAAARFFRMFMQSAILGFGAFLAIQHEISGGAIFAGSLLLGRCLAPIEAVTAAWRTTLSARDAYRRIGAIVPAASARPVTLPEPRGELALESVSWTPHGTERPVLRTVSLKIEAGAALAIIGPSAAGKSSLARILAGAICPLEGTVRLDGAELASWDPAQLGAAIGYLPQEPSLFPGTIAENIARFGAASDDAIIGAARRAHAHDMILRLPAGYATVLDEGAATLSGGQKQRIALARALLADPPVLVLDEPNANLDAEGEGALISALQEARQRRRTVILITHNSALLRLADYVATMVAGQVMRVQPTTEFLNRPAKVAASA